jgi:hypothetical protein
MLYGTNYSPWKRRNELYSLDESSITRKDEYEIVGRRFTTDDLLHFL